MGIILREPVREDEAELVALHIRCWEQTYAHLLPEGILR